VQIARVLCHVVATRKHAAYEGHKLLLVEPLGRELTTAGEELLAIDLVDAGVGDLVLVSSEGRFAREIAGATSPVRSTIIAVLAGVDFQL
jgi:microcompartment protein CcmK/EutM